MRKRPTTAQLCTTVAMVRSVQDHVSGGYTTEVDLIPVWSGDD